MRKRAGYSLVEVVLVLGAVSVVLGLCVGTIRGLITLDRASRARLNEGVTLDRLGRQFRQDVRAALSARSVQEPGKQPRLELRLSPDRVIEFSWDKNRLTRVERRPGTAETREPYRLPNRLPPTINVKESGGQAWVSLVLERKPDPARGEPKREFRIEARVGKDLRWARGGDKSR